MDTFTLSGTGVALVTPFLPNGQVDFKGLKRAIKHVLDGGVEYIVALGTTGETATLEADERLEVLDTIFEETSGRAPIVLGIGGNHTTAVCRNAREWSDRYPAAAILSVSPYYNRPSQEGIYQHYKQIVDSVDLPLILYNVPPRTASNISPDTTLRLATDFSQIIGTKEASGSMDQCMDILRQKPDGFELVSGDDLLTLPLIALGTKGIISVSANALARSFSDMTRAALAGNWELARSLHYEMQPLIRLNFAEGNPVGVKTLMELLGICGRDVRMPLMMGSEALVAEMQQLLVAH